jgi:type IV pilus assembly protein PilW
MKKENMKIQSYPNPKGITLIELMVALVICGLVVAGIYRVFVAQTKAYTIQDHVVELQQDVRSAMEILLRDVRMAGYDDDNASSTVIITESVLRPVAQNSVTVCFENYNTTAANYEEHRVAYWLDGANLKRQRTITVGGVPTAGPEDPLLENVNEFNITYGVDVNEDGAMDDQNADGIIDGNDWVQAASVGSTTKVIALRLRLTARPDQTNTDVQKTVSPRSLESIVTLRNLFLIR